MKTVVLVTIEPFVHSGLSLHEVTTEVMIEVTSDVVIGIEVVRVPTAELELFVEIEASVVPAEEITATKLAFAIGIQVMQITYLLLLNLARWSR